MNYLSFIFFKGFSNFEMIIGVLLLLLIMLLVLILIRNRRKHRGRPSGRRSFDHNSNKSNAQNNQNTLIPGLRKEVGKLKRSNAQLSAEIDNLKSELAMIKNSVVEPKIQIKERTKPEPDILSPEIDLGPPNSQKTIKLKEFFAGKPTPDRRFVEVTDKVIEQETVFKFNYSDESESTASFEVILASDFMKKEITNAPDDYLYRVCNNANSNQDFRREIITERKGIAHFRDGYWVVDELEKALIKFQ